MVTGDTKVVQRGKADGCYINTAGVGVLEHDVSLGVANAQPGDAIIVSGPIGDHGVTIMLARGELDIEADINSDTAPLNGLIADLLAAAPGVRALRDATRGGVATILNEMATAAGVGVLVNEDDIPVAAGGPRRLRTARHRSRCTWRAKAGWSWWSTAARRTRRWPRCAPTRSAADAAIIGHITADPPGLVLLKTAFGGTRIVDLLVGDPLPQNLLTRRARAGDHRGGGAGRDAAAARHAHRLRAPGDRRHVRGGRRLRAVLLRAGHRGHHAGGGPAGHQPSPAARCRCRDCGGEFEPDGPIALCGCGSADVAVLAGQELRITSVEVV